MSTVPMTRESRAVPTLLGGSGLIRCLPKLRRTLPVLLRPHPGPVGSADRAVACDATGG